MATNVTSVTNPLNSTGTSVRPMSPFTSRLELTETLPERTELSVNKQSINHYGVNTQNAEGITPLLLATQRCFACIVTMLLDDGANPNIAGSNGRVPLHYAALSGDEKSFDQLMDAQHIRVDATDVSGNTILHLAALGGHVGLIQKLLNRKMDCNVENKMLLGPLELACERGSTKAVEILLKGSSRKSKTNSFLAAVKVHNFKAVKQLLDAEADIDAKSALGNTALHHGAFSSDVKMLQVLLARRAALNPRDADGRTPLMDAASQNSMECLKMLLDAGADATATSTRGHTALWQAALAGHWRSVELLLHHTPLVGPKAFIKRNVSFADAALVSFNDAVVEVIIRYVTKSLSIEKLVSNDALKSCIEQGASCVERVRVVLDHGLDPNRNIGSNGSMLHYAALLDNIGLVRLLIEPHRGIKLDAIAENRGSALQIAAHEGKPSGDAIVALLLDRGANAKIGASNMKYGSPLHAAVAMPSSWDDEKYEDIAKIILDKDPAALHVVAGIYPTVLQAAVQGGTLAVIKLLLERAPDKGIVIDKYGTPLHLAAILGSY